MSGWTNQQPLSLTIGTIPGQHIIIANPATGDAVDVYDSLNRLVLAITADGTLTTYYAPDGTAVRSVVEAGTFSLDNFDGGGSNGGSVFLSNDQVNSGLPNTYEQLKIAVSQVLGAGNVFEVRTGSADGSIPPTTVATEGGITGSVLVSDQVSTNNKVHFGAYSVLTNASGIGTFAHGAAFTPAGGVATAFAAVAAGATQFSFQNGAWTGTDATVAVKTPAGAVYVGTATFYAAFWG